MGKSKRYFLDGDRSTLLRRMFFFPTGAKRVIYRQREGMKGTDASFVINV